MKALDMVRFCAGALNGYRLRTALMLLSMAIGVAAVVLLTALGEGARRYVSEQFTSLGSYLLIVLPGRSETVGGPPPMMADIPRDLTLEDAMALYRAGSVRRVAPIMVGSAPVSFGNLQRDVNILGSSADLLTVRRLSMAQGRFLPAGEVFRAEAVCVLGHKVKAELFGDRPALGRFVRIGERRFRVIGILAPKGESLGVHMGDAAIIPVASARALFNRESLFRILVEARDRDSIEDARKSILRIVAERHEGEDDITVITQDAILATFDRILSALTLAVAGIGAISLAVAGILVMNVMLIAVSQRTTEIGLLKAIGAPAGQIQRLFIFEAALLSLFGAAAGLLVAAAGNVLARRLFPAFPLTAPLWSPVAAVAVALVCGILFGWLPARRAAALDPVAALSRR